MRAVLAATLSLATVASSGAAPPATPKAFAPTAAERAAASTIRPELLRAHIRFLSDDLLEGRGPASRGDRLAQLYIASQLEALGLEPGAPDGTWFQPFDLVGVTSHTPPVLTLTRGAEKVELKQREEFIAVSGTQDAESTLKDAEIVFVGYGIVAPEYGWDDFKGVDVKGKVLLVMNNDPEDDPALFAGKTRLYYGRWGYKYESAARAGAAGAIIIHTEPSAGYKWQVIQTSWSGESFSLPHEGGPLLQVRGWTTEDASRRIAKLGGHDLDALRAGAQKKDFKPVPLGVSVSLSMKNDVQKKKTANVVGRLPGRDAVLKDQAIVYTAHHDHLGLDTAAKPGADAIYNGALDNASGVAAMLAVARAMKALPTAPRRSVLFAAVAAEEQGLLGSQYFAAHPPLPAGRLAANINIDGLNIWGRTRDLTMVGLGKSDLDTWIHAIAGHQGRHVVPDQFPDKGFFYRSDQFNLAKIGVPAAYFDAGTDVIGKPKGWGKEQQEKFEATSYHQPSDELGPDWDFSGGIEDTQLYFYLGLRVADTAALPAWKPGDEFEAARKKALADAK
jgi:Zn-dependent M28 family amino/carboxypeptidase